MHEHREGAGVKVNTPLEEYAMIGDAETAALVSKTGSIDWLCLPRFDSPACCTALLGTPDHGHWSIAPDGDIVETAHRYRPDTLILETDLTVRAGTIRLTDFMPIRSGNPVVIRIVTGLEGSVPTRLDACFRFDYGNMPPWASKTEDGALLHVGPDEVLLQGTTALEIDNNALKAAFTVDEDSRHVFVLTYGTQERTDDIEHAEKILKDTETFWRKWIGRFDRAVPHADAVRRSLITLKALIHQPTGGLVAALTTSLPEQPGGSMNWDYRYCWLRDATFTLTALVECGYLAEATAWRDWMLRAVAGEPDKMKIVYRVDGSRRLDEAELPWLPGYRYARPVRIGNAAAAQLQLDVYGELIRSLHAAERAGMERTEQGRHIEHAIVRHVAKIWIEPDQGLWESRGEPRHYVYSKVMAWAAIDSFLKGKGGGELDTREREGLKELRDRIHAVVCREGFDPGIGSFTSYFGGQEVDASLLLLPKVGFLEATDKRMAGTIERIERILVADGLVRRHRMDALVPEGAFVACSFWLAECQVRQGRRADAAKTIERALSIGSELGFLSEEYDVASKRLCGNYPQALSHLALIHAVLALDQLDRSDDAR